MKAMSLLKYYMTTCAFRTPHVCFAEMTQNTDDITVAMLLNSACHGRFLTNYIWIYINIDVKCILRECCEHLFKLLSFPTYFTEVVQINYRNQFDSFFMLLLILNCMESVRIRCIFWSIFPHIWTEYKGL